MVVTQGGSEALLFAFCALCDPGDEIIVFDPYFVMYPSLIRLTGATLVPIDTYPDFRIDVDRVRRAITPRTWGWSASSSSPFTPVLPSSG